MGTDNRNATCSGVIHKFMSVAVNNVEKCLIFTALHKSDCQCAVRSVYSFQCVIPGD